MPCPECLDGDWITGRFFKCQVAQIVYSVKSLTIEPEVYMKKWKCLKYRIANAVVSVVLSLASLLLCRW